MSGAASQLRSAARPQRRIALVRPQADAGDAEAAAHAIQLFDSVLWFSKGSTRCDWVASSPEQASVVVVHHAEPAKRIERWRREGKLLVVISTDRVAAVEHAHRLQYPFPAAQVLSLLDQLDAELGGAAPSESTQSVPALSEAGADPWSFVETLRTLSSASNAELWLKGKAANGSRVWVRADGACYACDDIGALRGGTLELHTISLQKAAPPPPTQTLRSGAELAWFAAYSASPALAPWLKASARYRLARWPDFGRVRALSAELRSAQIRLAATIESCSLGLHEAAARAKVTPEQAIRTFNALSACNLIEATVAVAAPARVAAATPAPPGGFRKFLQSLRDHLRLGVAS